MNTDNFPDVEIHARFHIDLDIKRTLIRANHGHESERFLHTWISQNNRLLLVLRLELASNSYGTDW